MKIINFNSGLGNQIFQYMFYLYLKSIHKRECFYGYYNFKWLKQHNGLEVDKVLDCELPKETFVSRFVAIICRGIHKFDKLGFFFVSDSNYNPNAIYYSGYWQDKKFFEDLPKPSFRKFELDEKNQKIRDLILNSNSVSVHIRRGDYLLPKNFALMGVCTMQYYLQAIELTKTKITNPMFFVFSDDIPWAEENLKELGAHFIDWNTGAASFLDMYLMAQCKAHIIANSTFSFWGAYLSKENKLTIYPEKWYNNLPSPNIASKDWIGI